MRKLNLILLFLCATLVTTLVTSSKPAFWPYYPFYCTKMVKDIHLDGSGVAEVEHEYYPPTFTQYKEDVYFAGSAGLAGVELWKTNGTAQGTVMVKNINPNGSSNPRQFCVADGLLFFMANDGIHGKELWKTDVTAQGTVLVKDIKTGLESFDGINLASIGNLLVFGVQTGVNHAGLWRSDGSANGTVKVHDTPPVYSIYDGYEVINGIYYYRANNQIWRSDGSAKGTYKIFNQNGDYLTNVNGTLYFGAGSKLYKSVGTVLAPELVKSLPDWNPQALVNYNGTLFFRANDPVHGFELWKSNGTAAGTKMVKDINPKGSSDPYRFFILKDKLLFRATDGVNGFELYTYGVCQ